MNEETNRIDSEDIDSLLLLSDKYVKGSISSQSLSLSSVT